MAGETKLSYHAISLSDCMEDFYHVLYFTNSNTSQFTPLLLHRVSSKEARKQKHNPYLFEDSEKEGVTPCWRETSVSLCFTPLVAKATEVWWTRE